MQHSCLSVVSLALRLSSFTVAVNTVLSLDGMPSIIVIFLLFLLRVALVIRVFLCFYVNFLTFVGILIKITLNLNLLLLE